MKPTEIIAKMKAGHTLRNHNKGYFLFPPYKAYVRQQSISIDQEIINCMEKTGLIRIIDNTWSSVAEMVDINNKI